MRFIKSIVVCGCILVLNIDIYSQCDYVAGNTCSTAPIICDLNCLDGFEGTLFPESVVAPYLSEQPPLLCWDGLNGFGTPTNLSWFAFIAGCDTAIISVTPSNCLLGDGIQLGLFDDCDFSNTTIGPNLDVNEFIACNTTTPYPGSVVISATNLKPGQTYYFFVDGNNGDVCDYTVNVIAACQADTLPNPKNFIGKTDTFETCPGTRFELQAEDFRFDIEYYWKIDPPTATYPYANFTKLDSLTKWRFITPGIYNISMYAYNRCDATDTLDITIEIKEPDDEIFDDVIICQNDFPFAGPLLENPNGDTIIGWLGPNILTPGLATYRVNLPSGCSYDQIVDVKQQILQPRQDVVAVDCQPFTIFGETFTENILDFPLSLPNADKNGCDSLIMLDAYILNLQGNLVSQSCNNGKITIGYNVFNVSSPTGYNISYEWKDENGNIIPDVDGDVTNITIDKPTELNLSLFLSVNGKTCKFDEAPFQIDPSQQLPNNPIPNNWELEFCEDNPIQILDLQNQSGIIKYNWTVNNGVVITGNPNGKSVTLDFTNLPVNTNTQVCVSVENACGVSEEVCRVVKKIEKPRIKIESIDTLCIGETLTINASNLSTANINNYNWSYTGGQLVSGNTTSSGPINISYNNAGVYQLSAFATNTECTSPTANHSILVLPNVVKPILSYQPFADKVIISWQSVTCAQSYNCYINGTFIKNTFALQLEIDGLITNTNVDVRIEAIGADCACGMASESIQAKTLSCTEVTLDLTSSKQIICEEDWKNIHQFAYQISGNLTNGNFSWSGSGVTANGNIRPETLGAGSHKVYLGYEEYGCNYIDSISIDLVKTPDAKLETRDPECKDETDGSVMILPLNGSGVLNYILDGNPMTEGSLMSIGIGNHSIQIIDANKCSVVKSFTINPPTYPEIEIKKGTEEPYYDNELINFSVINSNSELNLIDSIVWYINGEIVCSGDCSDISLEDYNSGNYNHQILIFYKNCEIRQDFEMQVKESPKVYTSNVLIANGIENQNSGFKIITNDPELEILSVDVYSRWGEKVFTKSSFIPEEGEVIWNGKVNGNYVVPGVYMYKLSYRNEKNVTITEIKDLTVIR